MASPKRSDSRRPERVRRRGSATRVKGIDKSSLEQGLAVGHLLHNERTVLYGQDSTGTLIDLGPVTTDADETIVVEGVDVDSKYYLAQSTLNHCEHFSVALRREVKCRSRVSDDLNYPL